MSVPGAKLRQRISREAARLLVESPELSVGRARELALERLAPRGARASDIPSESEIANQLNRPAPRVAAEGASVDRFAVFESLLLPLENVKQPPRYHPEGDALYHSLQVFDHARDASPYDEEFLTAALLHDVGKAIDPRDHVAAAAAALTGLVAERTAWLIEHHMLCHDIEEGRLGARTIRRLQESGWYDDLLLLGECDRNGRQAGVETPELTEALEYLATISS